LTSTNRGRFLRAIHVLTRLRGAFLFLFLILVLACGVLSPTVRGLVRRAIPRSLLVQFDQWRFGYTVDHGIRIRMRDGVTLAASLYLPTRAAGTIGTVYIRHPYDRLAWGEGLVGAQLFVRHGYAVLISDIRGKYASEGEFIPYRQGTDDGVDTLDWITGQPWSNGRVGTWGCSALGELQFVLARSRHPAHAAMIALGAGGAMGSALGRHAYFGVYEGGILQLASTFGWFLDHGAKDPTVRRTETVDIPKTLRELPIVDLVRRTTSAPNGYDEFVRTPLTDPFWQTLGYISQSDKLTTPALVITTWGDQTVGDTLALSEFVRETSPETARHQHVVVAPGPHCGEDQWRSEKFGDIEIRNGEQPYYDWYVRWFDYWLRDEADGLADQPAYLYYMLGEHRWLSASHWPPSDARMERWYLDSRGRANSRDGDGVLSTEMPRGAGYDEFAYDPMDPVPSRGGPVCCTGDPGERSGPVDQADVERRADVLVYTTPQLERPLRIAGPLRAHLRISSTARDTDFVARLVHVWPDGRATSIQEGALRARYRAGIEHPELLKPGKATDVVVEMRSIAYTIPAGHRLRLHVTSSSFPRLERNLNTGGRNFDESIPVVATNRVHHGSEGTSFVDLPLLPVVQ
jgi:putative CocE/NonD family hydrolase